MIAIFVAAILLLGGAYLLSKYMQRDREPGEERKQPPARERERRAVPAPVEEYADEREFVAGTAERLRKERAIQFVPAHELPERAVVPPAKVREALITPPEAMLDFSKYPEFGEDYVVLIARDPEYLFAYWEMTFEAVDRYARTTAESVRPKVVLRIHEAVGPGEASVFYDAAVGSRVGNYYFPVPPRGKAFYAEVGLVGSRGFWPIARSNTTVVPKSVGLPSDLEERLREYAGRACREVGKSSW